MPSRLDAPALRARLLAWFDEHRRDLPWRRARDPFAVWISEVMLQQTQVTTVIPYYQRFLARFPDARALAGAPLSEVLALWSGLGYYSRARNLHRAAQAIARDGMPRTSLALRELPGFGRYTAAAVASIAFGEPVAVVDGNVARVLARLLAIEAPLASVAERLWSEAQALVDPARPGAFNEAMMELGATVCAPSNPRCLDCPVHGGCAARRRSLQSRIPAPKARAQRQRLALACAAVLRDGAILLGRRSEKGLFGGLWELPSAELSKGVPAAALRSIGFAVLEREPIARVRRTLTHRELHLAVYGCRRVERIASPYPELRFVRFEHLGDLGISTAMARAIEAVRGAGAGRASPSGPKDQGRAC
jgi:A/G-specific adenine glycosylase